MAYNQSSSSLNVLGPDGKLSAAGAAASLKYAKPHELPSHPSVGIPNGFSGANRAASIAANGSNLDLWRYKGTDTGHSAASLAMKHRSMEPYQGVSEDGRQKALLAATMSINRGKAKQSPVGTPPLRSGRAIQATRVKHFDMPPEMFTEHPPVEVELEVQRYKDALHASAVSMAKQLYKLEQNKNNGPTASGKPSYPGLKEAAQQLAAERLAKLDPDGLQAYREHYGYGVSLGRSGIMDDHVKAKQIRGQTAQFSAMLANVDEEKRKTDRDNLMALAEKRVKERMRALDQQVFEDTGKALPSVATEWEDEARAKATDATDDKRLTTGKVHIGGGKYIDMSEVEAVAAARMQPTLDEITVTAQKRRERDEEIRIAEEERKKKLAEDRAEAQREKDEKRMKEYQEKTELRQKMAVEKAERDKVRAEENAERRRIKEEERAKIFMEKNEKRAQENVERAERQKIEAEQKAERKIKEAEQRDARMKVEAEQRAVRAEEKAKRDKSKAEERAVFERIKREEKIDRERERAEQQADRERSRALEREERLQRIADLRERQLERERLMKEEEQTRAAEAEEEAEIEAKEEDALAADLSNPFAETEDNTLEEHEVLQDAEESIDPSDAATQIKVGDTADETVHETAVITGDDDVVLDEQTEEGIVGNGTARNIASRVLGAPVDDVAEADETIVSRTVETDEGLKNLDDGVVVENSDAIGVNNVTADAITDTPDVESSSPVVNDTTDTLTPTTSATPRRESRRKSFFTKLRQSIKGASSRSGDGKVVTSTQSKTPVPAIVEPTAAENDAAEDAHVGPSIVGASTDGTHDTTLGHTEHTTERTEDEEETGLYSEPSDTTERPNEERRGENSDNISSIYATDDADYEEARARTSTSDTDRFEDAESMATARDNDEVSPHATGKFSEAI